MNKTILVLLVSAITWTSCTKEKTAVPLTQKEIKKQVDSIMSAKSKSIIESANRDLQLRLKIEVKGRADSLVRMHAKPDTTVKTPKI